MSDKVSQFNYPMLVDEAMRSVVRQILQEVYRTDLTGDHHFFISFNTHYPGVRLSPQLLAQYPQEMTIVMQHQFWDLQVEQSFFSLMLSFNNIPEKLVIPYDALTAFADPSVKFGLQFHARPVPDTFVAGRVPAEVTHQTTATMLLDELQQRETISSDNKSDDNNVVSLDAFRKH